MATTDPIEWIKDVVARDAEVIEVPTPDGATYYSLTNQQRSDAAEILRVAELARLKTLTGNELAAEILVNPSMAVREEVSRRLTVVKAVLAQQDPDPKQVGWPEGYHRCTGSNMPPEGIPCNCVHGVDHSEEFFEVPFGGSPRVSGNTKEQE